MLSICEVELEEASVQDVSNIKPEYSSHEHVSTVEPSIALNTETLSSSHLPEKSNNCEAEMKEVSGHEREQHQPALINAEDNF